MKCLHRLFKKLGSY